jgi:hypothetical protein
VAPLPLIANRAGVQDQSTPVAVPLQDLVGQQSDGFVLARSANNDSCVIVLRRLRAVLFRIDQQSTETDGPAQELERRGQGR